MKNKFIGLGKDIIGYGIMDGVARIIHFLLLPIFTRVFSTGEYGIVDIVATITSLTTTFARLALPTALARYFPEFKEDQERNSFITTILVCVGALSTALMLLSSLFSNILADWLLDNPENGPFIIMGFSSAMLTAITSVPLMVFRMEQRIIHFNASNIIYTVAYAFLALLFVIVFPFGLNGLFLASIIAAAIQLLIAIFWIRKYLTRKLSLSLLRRSLKFSLPTLPGIMVGWVNNQVDRLILLAFLGLDSVGIFGVAARLGSSIKLLTTIFRRAWIPYRMLFISSPPEERNPFYRSVLNYYTGLIFTLALGIISISPEIFQLLFPPEYYDGYVIMPWFIGSIILHDAGSITGLGILISEKTYASSIASWSGAILNVILATLLIPLYGINGAAIGTFLAEMTFAGIQWYFTVRFSDIKFSLSTVISVLFYYISSAILLLWVAKAIQPWWISLSIRLIILTIAALLIINHSIDKKTRETLKSMGMDLPAQIRTYLNINKNDPANLEVENN
ncbi:lipopolysaccharide biosynthesis protein [Chloroflexota bacterium]